MTSKVRFVRINNLRTTAALACMIVAAPISIADGGPSKDDAASPPGVIFSALLPEIPGKRLTVVELEFDAGSEQPSVPHHRHPGSVYVYVTRGSVRFGLEGEPVRLLRAGESFFEPAGVLHTTAENASTTEPASVIAVVIMPDGAPILTLE